MAEKEYKTIKLEKSVFERLKERVTSGKSYSMVVEDLLNIAEKAEGGILPEGVGESAPQNTGSETENPIRDYATIFNDVKKDRDYALKVIDYVEKHYSRKEANTLRWITGIPELKEDE